MKGVSTQSSGCRLRGAGLRFVLAVRIGVFLAGCLPEFDSSKAHFRPTPSNGAGFRAMGRQKPRYTGC